MLFCSTLGVIAGTLQKHRNPFIRMLWLLRLLRDEVFYEWYVAEALSRWCDLSLSNLAQIGIGWEACSSLLHNCKAWWKALKLPHPHFVWQATSFKSWQQRISWISVLVCRPATSFKTLSQHLLSFLRRLSRSASLKVCQAIVLHVMSGQPWGISAARWQHMLGFAPCAVWQSDAMQTLSSTICQAGFQQDEAEVWPKEPHKHLPWCDTGNQADLFTVPRIVQR